MLIVILTRFSRVTFNAAHKYLGLTAEVLRTEKAINDIACHPLPASFYEGGGLQYLRQRFDGTAVHDSDNDADYFNYTSHTKDSVKVPVLSKDNITESPLPMRPSPARQVTSRHEVQAGDLHSMTAQSEVYRPITRTFSISNTPRVPRASSVFKEDAWNGMAARISGDDFDLRDEVMSCIAKSIGLLQPPLSGGESVEASPAFPATDGSRSQSGPFKSSFGSLSLLDLGDDSSSMTGGSSSAADGYMSGLDNEVEILFFAAGSTLAKAGERNTGNTVTKIYTQHSLMNVPGLFYVIEGFLDILLPVEETDLRTQSKPSMSGIESRSGPEHLPNEHGKHKLLFTVKPGGIAGYLGKL